MLEAPYVDIRRRPLPSCYAEHLKISKLCRLTPGVIGQKVKNQGGTVRFLCTLETTKKVVSRVLFFIRGEKNESYLQ